MENVGGLRCEKNSSLHFSFEFPRKKLINEEVRPTQDLTDCEFPIRDRSRHFFGIVGSTLWNRTDQCNMLQIFAYSCYQLNLVRTELIIKLSNYGIDHALRMKSQFCEITNFLKFNLVTINL